MALKLSDVKECFYMADWEFQYYLMGSLIAFYELMTIELKEQLMSIFLCQTNLILTTIK